MAKVLGCRHSLPVALTMIPLLFVCLVNRFAAGDSLSEISGHELEVKRGHERVSQLARRYEVVAVPTSEHYDEVLHRSRRDAHPLRTVFRVRAFGKLHVLDLELNENLLPPGHVQRWFKENGEEVVEREGVVNCYYQGHVRGQSNSHAVLSTCDGLMGSFGVGPPGYWTDDETFFIEPLTSRPSPNGTHLHAVFRARDAHDHGHRSACGVGDHNHSHNHQHADEMAVDLSPIVLSASHRRTRRNVLTEQKTVELMIVADNRVYIRQGRSVLTVGNRARSVANFVDSVYKALNVRTPLVAVEVWSAGDRIGVSSIAGTTLGRFNTYRTAQLINKFAHDNAQFMTGIDFDGNTVGIARVKGMCSRTASSGANQDRGSVNGVGGTIAHEMGHNLGMSHDDSGGRSCTCSSNTGAPCIMASVSNGIPPTIWSSCSRSDLNAFLNMGGGSCLFNVPTQLFGDPVCGNGFVESGEQCDCGSVSECTDSCCDASTCRLTTGSQCSFGECCTSCRFRAAGTTCRSKINSCDIPETCTGTSHVCPDNLYLQNGQPCGSGTSASYCYDGMCKTRSTDCRRVWGLTTTGTSDDVCYSRINTRGDKYGNCGKVNGVYVKCSTANVFCGALFCTGGPRFPIIQGTVLAYNWSIGSSQCRGTTITQSGADMVDPGLVDDGVVCGTNSICISHQCRSISSLGLTPCGSSGGRLCSGNGVCTNLDRCLCNNGWMGSACHLRAGAVVNGGWGVWSLWTECSHSCGTSGRRTRTRSCNNPPPSNGGAACSGVSIESEACNRSPCPQLVNGMWGAWMAWQPCSATCGASMQTRYRACNNPPPQNGGKTCVGSWMMTQACNLRTCGVWGQWSSWGLCSSQCSTGQQSRTRSCSANDCTGGSVESRTCVRSCVPNVNGGYTPWSDWSMCSVSCGQGSHRRTRTCDNPPQSGSGLPCSGSASQTQSCSLLPSCNNVWSSWSNWTACPVTCGGSVQGRSRVCLIGNCTGSNSEVKDCAFMECKIPVHGGWTAWSAWYGNCTPCVENVVRTRYRNCTNPAPSNGGSYCSPPQDAETSFCPCGGSSGSSSGSSAAGTIAGVIVAIAIIALLALLAAVWYRRRRSGGKSMTSVDPRRQQQGAVNIHVSHSQENLLDASRSSATPSPVPFQKAYPKSSMQAASSTDNLLMNTSRENSPEPMGRVQKPFNKPPPPPPGAAKGSPHLKPMTGYVPPRPTAPPLSEIDGGSKPSPPRKPAKPPMPPSVGAIKPMLPPQTSPPNLARKPAPTSVPPKPAPVPKPHAPPAKPPQPPSARPAAPVSKPPAPPSKPPTRLPPVAAVKPTQTGAPTPPSGRKAMLPPGGKVGAQPGNTRAELTEKLMQRWPPGSS